MPDVFDKLLVSCWDSCKQSLCDHAPPPFPQDCSLSIKGVTILRNRSAREGAVSEVPRYLDLSFFYPPALGSMSAWGPTKHLRLIPPFNPQDNKNSCLVAPDSNKRPNLSTRSPNSPHTRTNTYHPLTTQHKMADHHDDDLVPTRAEGWVDLLNNAGFTLITVPMATILLIPFSLHPKIKSSQQAS